MGEVVHGGAVLGRAKGVHLLELDPAAGADDGGEILDGVVGVVGSGTGEAAAKMDEVHAVEILGGPGVIERVGEVGDAVGLGREKLTLDVTAKVVVLSGGLATDVTQPDAFSGGMPGIVSKI